MKNSVSRRSRRGFTLVELLVCVLITEILAAFALPSYITSVYTARQSATNEDARLLAESVQSKAIPTSTYDTTLADYASDMGGAIPMNQCTQTTTGWTITSPTSTTARITASAGTHCGTWTPKIFALSL